jgi:general secretion pathway protein F
VKYFKILYKAGGKKSSIVLEAPNRLEAVQEFMKLQIGIMIKIEEIAEPLSFKIDRIVRRFKDPIKKKRVDTERLIAILEQLSVMLDAGLPLNFALGEIVQNEKDPMLRAIFSDILENIESGMSFYEAAKRYERQLGNLTLSMIRLGEETGQLAEEVGHLAKILQEILDNRRKFKKATRYPTFILAAMAVAFVVVVVMVIPQFEEFFKESKMDLPLPTKFLLWLEHAAIDYGPYILVGAMGVAAIISYLYMKNDRVRLALDRFILKIFIVGKATYYAMISRFLYIFRVLHDAGIPMIDAINIALEVVDNSYLRQKIRKIPAAIEEGRTLYQGFSETELFENMVLQMLRSGETGGGLSRMLDKINKIYKDRFDYIVENIAVLIEPVLIAAIAGFVLTLALGIFLPMWNMVEVAG